MLELAKHPLPLKELLEVGSDLSAEKFLAAAQLMRPLVTLQEHPDIALIALSAIYLPPHQRTILRVIHAGAGENVIVASRGTAKSSTVCCLYPTYMATVFPNRKALVLSSTGFRGSQFMFLDIARWLRGGWDSQQQEAAFFRDGIGRRPDPINKSASFWSIDFDSESAILGLPTKDQDLVRGTRAHDVFPDETNFMDKELIDKVLRPMLNVKGDMRHGGVYSKKNRIFFTSTIDYSYRPYQETIAAARDGLVRDQQAREVSLRGDHERFDELEKKGLYGYSFLKFDYTDVLIRRFVTTRDGRKFECFYPDTEIPLIDDKQGIPFTERDPITGGMSDRSGRVEYWPTYAVDKEGIERPLRDGSSDSAGWKAEQRNIVDTATGDVYSHELVANASCEGARYIIPYEKLTKNWQEHYKETGDDYIPPILWSCSDPCVLGVDYAPTSDFCAFVVIRMGPCAAPAVMKDKQVILEFDPFQHAGRTPWSNVIWAEQHRRMTARDAADKIRYLMERYNIHSVYDPRVTDDWLACRGIGLDFRGGGTAIRDELCWFTSETGPPEGEIIIFDPLDKDPRIANFAGNKLAKPIMDGITAGPQTNDKLVEFTKGMMEQRLLFIGKWLDDTQRPVGKAELNIGYNAVRILRDQLRKLRQQPTQTWRKFYMEGDTEQDRNKKDLWAAFCYAAKQLRAHLFYQQQKDNTPAPMGLRVVQINSHKGAKNGRATGARR